MRFHNSVAAAAALLLLTGVFSAAPARAFQDDGLPEGEGKRILQASCTACHDLTEVTKFRGYYTRDEWRDVVKTMIEYGAKVNAREADVLVEYLAVNLGKNETPSGTARTGQPTAASR